MLIKQALVAVILSLQILQSALIICEMTRSIAQYDPLIESDKIRLLPVLTNGTNVTLLDEGLYASFLQNLLHMLGHSIVCCQMRSPCEPRVAKHPIGCITFRDNMDRHARVKT